MIDLEHDRGESASRRHGFVDATEGLYQSIFATAFAAVIVLLGWGVVSAALNTSNHHRLRSVLIGAICLPVSLALWPRRRLIFLGLRARPGLVVGIALAGIAVLWADGGWRSSFYLASFAAVAFAAVACGVRWAVIAAAIAAVGYLLGLALWGYDLDRLQALNDLEWVAADFLAYFVVAVFVSRPVDWLGGYVVRINQILGDAEAGSAAQAAVPARVPSPRTDSLTVREAEIVHLVADGKTNDEIAHRLVLSPRTVHNHVANAMRKTGARNRTELAMLAVREGIVP